MVDYQYASITIDSAFDLPCLHATESRERKTVRLRGDSAPPPCGLDLRFQWQGRYGLKLMAGDDRYHFATRFGDHFALSPDGSEIIAYEATSGLTEFGAAALVRRILPRLAMLKEAIAIHGATMALGTKSILLLGASGAGKSTMTAALARQSGWQIHADDISILWPQAQGLMSSPSTRGVSVWPASQSGLKLPLEQCHAMAGYDGKLWFDAPVDSQPDQALLGDVVLLDRQHGRVNPVLERIDPGALLSALIAQLIKFDPGDGLGVNPAFALPSHLASLRGWRLAFPDDYNRIDEATAHIAALMH